VEIFFSKPGGLGLDRPIGRLVRSHPIFAVLFVFWKIITDLFETGFSTTISLFLSFKKLP
jgi:hypothetical protein